MDKNLKRMRKNNRMKAVIGTVLFLVIAYVIYTNGGVQLLKGSVVTEGEKTTCTEVRGPKDLTDTVTELLKVEDLGFAAIETSDLAEITVRNIDDRIGAVTVRLYCRNGEEQGVQTLSIPAGETETFVFMDVPDCDLDYIVEPDFVTRKVNRTGYSTDVLCE